LHNLELEKKFTRTSLHLLFQPQANKEAILRSLKSQDSRQITYEEVRKEKLVGITLKNPKGGGEDAV